MPNHDPRAIANEFINRATQEGMRLTNMQLQKLPYIAHGWALALLGEPLIRDVPQAWRYGPVYPDLYQALRRYGSGNVLEPIRENDMDATAFVGSQRHGRGNVIHSNLNEEESRLLEAVWHNYKSLGAFQLSEMTHRPDTPWTRVHEEAGDYAPIPNDLIADHYREMLHRR